jgi:hypothetical protein
MSRAVGSQERRTWTSPAPDTRPQKSYGQTDTFDHEGLRSGRRQPPDDLQLDLGRQSGIHPDGGWIDSHLCRFSVARRERPAREPQWQRFACDACGHAWALGLTTLSRTIRTGMDSLATDPQLRVLFHQLNNQLGIVLAHAELLEAKSPDMTNRARAEQVVKSVLDAMGTAKEIRRRSEAPVTA